jgi:hypothetical protein
MEQKPRPLYGELVIDSTEEETESGIQEEVSAMKEQIRLMTEEAAYYLAQRRGFKPGYELEDWLRAEEQIKKKL